MKKEKIRVRVELNKNNNVLASEQWLFLSASLLLQSIQTESQIKTFFYTPE